MFRAEWRVYSHFIDRHCFLLYFTLFASANFSPYITDDRESFKTGAPNFFYFYHGSNKMRTTSTSQEIKYLYIRIIFLAQTWSLSLLLAWLWFSQPVLCKCECNGCMESLESEPLAGGRSALHHSGEGRRGAEMLPSVTSEGENTQITPALCLTMPPNGQHL